MPSSFTKDPNAILDYVNDWSDWLDGDKIASSTWTPPSGITVAASSFTDTTATVMLSGGTTGNIYGIVNHIVTDAGRQDDRTITVTVAQK